MTKFKEYFQQKKKEFLGKVEYTVGIICDFTARNWDKIVVITPIAITLIKKGYNYFGVKRLQERYIYDRSAGHYWYCKRKPRKKDFLEIERRRKNGEKYGEILQSLGLI